MEIRSIASSARWAAALALALAVTAPGGVLADEAKKDATTDAPVVSAPATAVTAGPDIAPSAPAATTPPATPAAPEPSVATTRAPEPAAPAQPAPVVTTTAQAPSKPAGMDGATAQVKTGASQIGDGKVLSGTGQLAKGVGMTVVEGTKAAGRGVVRGGQLVGGSARSVWSATFDAVVDVSDTTVDFFKRVFDF